MNPLSIEALIEHSVLDAVDGVLLRRLTAHMTPGTVEPFLAVAAALLMTVKSGGIRLPLAPGGMAWHIEKMLPIGSPSEKRTMAMRFAEAFTVNWSAGSYSAVIGTPGEFLPIIAAGEGLYFQKYHAAETAVSRRLAYFLDAEEYRISGTDQNNILDTVLHKLPLGIPGSGGVPLEFDPDQIQALRQALTKRFLIISGGPGTGKTSLAANLLRAWSRAWISRAHASESKPVQIPSRGLDGLFPRIRLAAPTGRAAQRLSDALRRNLNSIDFRSPFDADFPGRDIDAGLAKLNAETLHALLRYRPRTGEFDHGRGYPLPADLVLIDEASMVDIFTLAQVLEALEDGATLILMGDMDQLPSVEAGSVLADLVSHGAASRTFPSDSLSDGATDDSRPHRLAGHIANLRRSHRSQAGILEVARLINLQDGSGTLEALKSESNRRHCRLLTLIGDKADYRAGLKSRLKEWVRFHYQQATGPSSATPDFELKGLPDVADDFSKSSEDEVSSQPASYARLIEILCRNGKAEYLQLAHITPLKESPVSATTDPEKAEWLELLTRAFLAVDRARILTFTRTGWYGSTAINESIRRKLAPVWNRFGMSKSNQSMRIESQGPLIGAPLLIQENDAALKLFNGDVGILLRVEGKSVACFQRAHDRLFLPAAFLPRHEIAFAMTVHKSQGSEFAQALVILPEAGNRLLYKETLYTALTRAREFAAVYGPEQVVLEALTRKVERESGLPEWLREERKPSPGC